MTTDVLIYWRDFRQNWERQFDGDRASMWHSNAKVVSELQPGDHLWMVTSGAGVGNDATQAGFLVGIWKVKEVLENPDGDPAYPREDYRFRVVADAEHDIAFADPIPVDHILRPEGRDKAVSIGRFLQGPRKLNQNTLRLLRAAAGPDLALKWLTGNKP